MAQSVGSPTMAKSMWGNSPDFKSASIPPVPEISSSAVAATTKLKPRFSLVWKDTKVAIKQTKLAPASFEPNPISLPSCSVALNGSNVQEAFAFTVSW